MSLLSIKHIFGIESNSIYYLNEHCFIYSSIRHIIIYDIDYQCQYIISYENENDKLELLTLSSNKEYLVIVLNRNRIILYEINSIIRKSKEKQKKTFLLKEKIRSNDILSLNFSNNSKYLLVLQSVEN
jgi:uncharacterized protein YjiK